MMDIEPLLDRMRQYNTARESSERLCIVLCGDGSGHIRTTASIPWQSGHNFGTNLLGALAALDNVIAERSTIPTSELQTMQVHVQIHRAFASVEQLVAVLQEEPCSPSSD